MTTTPRALLAIAILTACQSFAQTTPALKIHVVDPGGLAVSQADISFRSASGAPGPITATASTGDAEVRFPIEGRYLVRIHADGFTDEVRTIQWNGQPQTISVSLVIGGLQEQITVTSGSRVEELQDESTVKVDAVTRATMQNTGSERVSDVLAEIPGVVTRSGSTATVAAEQIRGVGARQVAVLQDGLPMIGARGIKSGNLNLNRQSTGRLDRVEVAKGASSALYGSDAMGGVINMISREPTQKIQGSLSFSGGSLGMFDGRGDIGTRYKRLSLFADLEQHRQDAYGLLPGSIYTVGPDYRRTDGLFKARYQFSPRFSLGFNANAYHNREEGKNAGETGPVKAVANDSVQNYSLVADIIPTSTTTLQLRGYSARYDENSATDSLSAPAPTAYANLNERYKRLDGTISQRWGSRQLIQGGYEWVQDNYKGANRLVGDNAGRQVTSNDVWLQDRIQILPRVTLDIGGRVTNHALFGSKAVPRAGLVVRITDRLIARGSFGMGFRAPDLGQLYYRFANPASFYQVIGNPTLQSETSRSFSTGADYRMRRTKIGFSLYRNDVRNLIDSINIGTPTTTAQMEALLVRYGIPANFTPLLGRQLFIYQNLGRVYTQGFEANAEQAITRSLKVSGAYAYLDARDSKTHLALTQRHKHQGYARAEYSNARLGLYANVRGTFFSKWYLNAATGTKGFGYGIWDLYVSKKLPRDLQAFLAVDNFANSRDQKLALATPTFDRPDYGRQYRVGLRWQFGKE